MQPSPRTEAVRTRILATLGPATWDRPGITALLEAGADAFRLNFSHGAPGSLDAAIREVRAVAGQRGESVALVADLAGPKLRTGPLGREEEVLLPTGEVVLLSPDFEGTVPGKVAVDPAISGHALQPGMRVLLNDGRIELRILRVRGREAEARVEHGGRLGSHKGVNLPDSVLDIPALTDKDEQDLRFALERDADFIALSFVRDARDVVALKRLIAESGGDTPVIAKIEMPAAVRNLERILEVSDGIMVARGDLGVELGPEELPVVQKRIIEAARRSSKLVITATQMLESMTRSPRPTRAESSDVANAIFDGSDVVMLSEETAVGAFPSRAVEVMRRIAGCVEASDLFEQRLAAMGRPQVQGVTLAAVRAACVAAEQLRARAIIPFTSSGWTAFTVAALRPSVPILPCTPSPRTFRRLSLCWGGRPVLIPEARDLDDLYRVGVHGLVRAGFLRRGDVVVMLSGSVVVGTGADTIKIFRVGGGGHAVDGDVEAVGDEGLR